MAKEKAEAPVKPTFVARPFSALPKREPPKNEIDTETANALLSIMYDSDAAAVRTMSDDSNETVIATATDGVSYAETSEARGAANKAARLVRHVLPDGKIVKTRVFKNTSGAFEWSIWLADETAEEATETPAKA